MATLLTIHASPRPRPRRHWRQLRDRLLLVLATAGCGRVSQDVRTDSAATIKAVRDTLVDLGIQDQAGRDSVGMAAANNDVAYMQRMMRGDSARTRWVQAFVAAHGWPGRATYGDSAVSAAFLIVQHSPDYAFQEQMLPLLEKAAVTNDVRRQDVAMLADRIAMHRGRPQRYGTQFSLVDGTMVAHPIADLTALDSLRATVGLPPMSEYAKLLGDVYKLPVQWPPKRP